MTMGTAPSLFFFVIGAVLAFAVRREPAGLDLTTVGVIIMLASVVNFGWTVYRERWRHRLAEESIEQGNGIPPIPLDDTVLVDPAAPIVAPTHVDIDPERYEQDTVPRREHQHR
jgi:hypothetical protein